MKSIKKLFLILSAACLIMACSKDDDGGTPSLINEKQITSFQFLSDDNAALSDDISGVINESTKAVTVIVPFSTNVTSLTPEVGVSTGASYSPEGAQDFTSPVIYTVTAEDGSTVTYTVSVTIEENNAKQITSFRFLSDDNSGLSNDVTGIVNETEKTISASVPYGTDVTALLPEVLISAGASYSPEGVQDFTSPIIYTVTAADNSTENYTVNVTVEENDAKQITSFQFLTADNATLSDDATGVIDEEEKNIIITLPHGTDLTALIPEIEVSAGATVTPEGSQDFTTPVIYTVTAGNGTTEDYTITIKIPDIDILNLIFNENPGNTLGWDTSNPDISTWEGVTTDENGEVIAIALRDKNLNSIPVEIGQLTNLYHLDLATNNLTSLPAEIGQLTNLSFLNLGSNDLSTLPDEIWQLDQLNTLSFYNNNLTFIPAEIGQLVNLQLLNLSVNNITSLPEEIWGLTRLQVLSLSSNSLTSISSGIGHLVNLTELNVGNNNLTSIPLAEIGQLMNLKHLTMSYNNLSSFPEEILSLTNLEYLDLSGNSLTSLPAEILQLNNLKLLALYSNNISGIPVEIGQLTQLNYLSFYSNSLTSIPEEIGLLTNLETLDLLINSLTTIPQAVCDLETNHGTTINKDAGVTCTP